MISASTISGSALSTLSAPRWKKRPGFRLSSHVVRLSLPLAILIVSLQIRFDLTRPSPATVWNANRSSISPTPIDGATSNASLIGANTVKVWEGSSNKEKISSLDVTKLHKVEKSESSHAISAIVLQSFDGGGGGETPSSGVKIFSYCTVPSIPINLIASLPSSLTSACPNDWRRISEGGRLAQRSYPSVSGPSSKRYDGPNEVSKKLGPKDLHSQTMERPGRNTSHGTFRFVLFYFCEESGELMNYLTVKYLPSMNRPDDKFIQYLVVAEASFGAGWVHRYVSCKVDVRCQTDHISNIIAFDCLQKCLELEFAS